MRIIHKNNILIGMVMGTLLPVIAYILLLFIYARVSNIPEDIDPYKETLLLERISIFANLAGFYYFLNKGHYKTVQGIVILTFIMALIYAIVYFNK